MKILFTGDICFKGCFENNSNPFSAELVSLFESVDYIHCDLEGPIYDNELNNPRGLCLFSHSRDVKKIIDYGFNVFSIANNHICDLGVGPVQETIKFLILRQHQVFYVAIRKSAKDER